MMPSSAFLIAALLLAVTPGSGIAYVVARTVADGRAAGVASCVGTAIGGLIHVLAAVFGLSLLITQSALAFSIIKGLGAVYLIFLGIRMLGAHAISSEMPTLPQAGVGRALRDGIFVEALNVKTALFFLAFLPQFISSVHAVAPQFILLGVICVAFNTTADLLAVAAAHRFVESGGSRAVRERFLARASGVTMLGLGVYVALAKREA